jgi:hypothetical protein
MPTRVQQHVGERPPHLARRAQRAVVVAAVEHRAAPPAHAVHRPREPRGDALLTVREGLLAVRLHDQVRVIALERVVRDSEAASLARLGQGALPFLHERDRSQRRDALAHAKRDVDRTGPGHRPAAEVQHARPRAARPAGADARPFTPRPPSVVGERKLLRSSAFDRAPRRGPDHRLQGLFPSPSRYLHGFAEPRATRHPWTAPPATRPAATSPGASGWGSA